MKFLTMNNFKGHQHTINLGWVVALFMVSGCEYTQRDLNFSTPGQWHPQAALKSSQQYAVRFRRGVSLSSSDERALKDLYYSFQDLDKVQVRLGVTSLEKLSDSSEMIARLSHLHRYFHRLGIPDYHINVMDKSLMPEAEHQGQQSSIYVVFEEYRAVPPRCPGWDQVMNGQVSPEGEAHFGCSSEYNLASMIANPSVLRKARPHGHSDGARSSLAVKDYRTDHVKALRTMQVTAAPDIGGMANSSQAAPSLNTAQ